MPNIVNQTFFVGELQFPNLTHAADLEKLTTFINKYEPECLLKILGYPLYKLFGSESSQRMTDLLSGQEYTDGENCLRKWQGIKHDTTISLIANYVYFFLLRNNASHTSGVGTRLSKPEAATAFSPADKMANAWNFFSSEVYDMTHFLWLKKGIDGLRVYPEFTYHQFLETRRISRFIDSVFEF